MEVRALASLLLLTDELLGRQELGLEIVPSALEDRSFVPAATFIKVDTCFENESIGCGYNLRVGVWLIPVVGEFHAGFDLIDESFQGGVGVPGGVHVLLVVDEILWSDVTVGGEEESEKFAEGDVGKSHVTIALCSKVDGVD